MKKSAFMILFIGLQLFFIFFYIYHHSALISRSYQKQKYEKKKLQLNQKKKELKQELHASHDLAQIKQFAVQSRMQKVTLEQIKNIPE